MKKNKPFRLLVEGINDLHVVCNLANRLSLLETFEVEDIGSYQQILKVLPVLLKGTNNLQRLLRNKPYLQMENYARSS